MTCLIKRIRTTINEIYNINSLKELLNYTTLHIEKISAVLLGLWILTPIFILMKATQIVNEKHYEEVVGISLRTEWNVFLQQIGFMGLFVLIILVCNYIMNYERPINEKLISVNLISWLLVLMLIWSAISAVFSDNRMLSFYGSIYRKDGLLSYIAYSGIFSCGYAVRNDKLIIKLLSLNTWVAAILSILMLIDNDTVNNIFNLYPGSAVFYNINHFGYYLCIAIMCSVTLILSDENKSIKYKLLKFLIYTVLTAALVVNSSYGPYLAVIAGIGLLILFKRHLDTNKKRRLYLIIMIFIIVSLVINIMRSSVFTEIKRLLFGIGSILKSEEDAGLAGSGRWELWVNGIKFIFEKPLFGYGPENLGRRYMMEGIEKDRPHNEIIQFAASLGIPAALFYMSAILIHFRNLFKYSEYASILCIGLYSIVFTYLSSSMFGNTMFYTSPFYFMILGLSIGNMTNIITEQQLYKK